MSAADARRDPDAARTGSRRRDRREVVDRGAGVAGGDRRDRVARRGSCRPNRESTSVDPPVVDRGPGRRPSPERRPRRCRRSRPTTTAAPRRPPSRPDGVRSTVRASVRGRARLPARPRSSGGRSTRSTRASPCSSPRRPARARRSSPSTRSTRRSPTGGKAFYTTPLKALSNQKYGDLVRAHGASRVGLLTGDNSINGDAPIVVMTTEVLRNMIYAASPTLDDLRYVVLDEVHYLQDRYRGPGVGGGDRPPARRGRPGVPLGDGVERRGGRRRGSRPCAASTAAIIEERRPVDARAPLPGGGAGRRRACTCCPTFVAAPGRRAAPQPRGGPARRPQRARPGGWRGPAPRAGCARPSRVETVELLAGEGDAAGDRVRLQPRRAATRPSSSASPPGCASPTPEERARDPRHRRGPDRAASPTTTSTCSATTSGSPGSRPASPHTTPAWCRR